MMNLIEKILREARVINPNWGIDVRRYDGTINKNPKEQPIKDTDRIRVYHGINHPTHALSMIENGFSGGDHAKRIYSYESGNNPKGVFVTIDFKIAKQFCHSGIIIEFDCKASDLEAPVWKGQDSYYVQGQYTQSFKDDEERNQETIRQRNKHYRSDDEKVAKSDRPELANSIFQNYEKQALFIGHCNPENIKAVWVHEKLFRERNTRGDFKRISRKQYLNTFGNETKGEIKKSEAGKYNNTYNDDYRHASGRAFKPNEDFSLDKMEQWFKKKDYSLSDIPYVLSDSYYQKIMLWPKQIAQVQKKYSFSDKHADYNSWKKENGINEARKSPHIYTVYHGTSKPFTKFNVKMGAQGLGWFTDDKESILNGESGASGRATILTCKIKITNPAGWDEYEKYTLGQLRNMGYDGIILPKSNGKNDYVVFKNNQVKILTEAKKNEFSKLEKNKKPLTDEERKEVMAAKATWNHGKNGTPSPAVWKSVDSKGKITYITHTHRCFQTASTLKGAINKYHTVVKQTA